MTDRFAGGVGAVMAGAALFSGLCVIKCRWNPGCLAMALIALQGCRYMRKRLAGGIGAVVTGGASLGGLGMIEP